MTLAAPPTDRRWHHRRSLLAILVLAVFLSGCTTPGAAAAPEFVFERHEAVLGSAPHQTVLAGFLLSGALADLAVVRVDRGDRRLSIYSFSDGAWAPSLEATLGSGVSFVDVAEIGGRDRLIAYHRGHLDWFDPEAQTVRKLVAVTSDFDPRRRGVIPHVDVTHDLNADGRDDLVVPDAGGFWVLIQKSDGTFADPVAVGHPLRRKRIYGADGYRYNPWGSGQVHETDYDRDGRGDLVSWNEDHFEVHLQGEDGMFAPEATTFTTAVAFDSDDIATLVAPEGVRRRNIDEQPPGAMTGRVLHSLSDHNGDGVADLAVFSLRGGSLWRMRSTYEVHSGAPAPDGGTVFAPEVRTVVRAGGIPFGVDRYDFEPDGRVDIMYTTIDPGPFMMIRAILSALFAHSIPLDLELYCMEGDRYRRRPCATRTIKASVPSGEAEEGSPYFPPVLVGDVNGDERADLLLGRSGGELRVFLGVPGPKLFTRRPQKVDVTMPRDEEYTWLVDLDDDGTLDVLMHLPSATGPDRVTILVAR